jgi:hypothetical protein
MPGEHRFFDEIEVTVSGFFTTHHRFATENGMRGEFTFPAFASYATIRTAGGRELLMQKIHWLGSARELIDGDVVHGTADRQSLFSREIAIAYGGREYLLAPAGFLSKDWYLTDDEGRRLVALQPRGILSQDFFLMTAGSVDVELLAFAYYLVHVRKQEDTAAAAAAAS